MTRSAKAVRLAPLLATAMVVASAALAVLASGGDGAEAGTTITIEVSSDKFCTPGQNPCPATPLDTTVAASVGNTIRFQHVSGSHTASHCTDGTFTNCSANSFDFSVTGGTNDWLVPAGVNNSNVYFRCNIHPSMQGIITVGSPATPTPTPSPAPSPSPTASPAASPTATPAPTLSGRSDVNCDGKTSGDDVLALLLHSADPPPTAAPLDSSGCAPIGSGNGDGPKGDLNCDGLVDARDALVALYGWAGITVPGLPQGCPGP